MMANQLPGLSWRWDRGGGGLATLWFDRRDASRNSLDASRLDELDERLAEIESDRDVGVLLLRSGKPEGFCVGADLKQILASPSAQELETYFRRGVEVFDRIRRLRATTVALIHGDCLGGGLELALACRHRLALVGAETRLGTPEVRLGLIPGWGAISDLPRLIGLRPALTLLLGGDPVDPRQAEALGLVDGCIAEGEQGDQLARLLSTTPPEPASWPPPDWEEALSQAREELSEDPDIVTEARRRILDVLEADLTMGRPAGIESALTGLSSLAMRPDVRDVLRAFFQRPRPR